MTRVHLGLGGNLGDPADAMRQALHALDRHPDTRVIAVSRLYRTPPWGKTDQPSFLNAAAALDTDLGPEELLEACLASERALKRERGERWGPRTIDIDILDFGGLAHAGDRLTLPHPRIGERAFVLRPLADIAPGLLVEGRPVSDWLRSTDCAGITPASEDGTWWQWDPRPATGG